MPTIVQCLDRESREGLHDMCLAVYLDGGCYAFATALHEGLGWSIVGLMQGAVIRHAAVQSPDGRLLDARGFIPEEVLGQPFGFMPPHDLREIVSGIPLRAGESIEARANSVRMARKMAEALWPELPWHESLAKRTTAFADELETLCRKHKLWIRPPVPAQAPIIAIGDGDEGGYKLSPTIDGMSFTIDRYFP